jgi:hypothetical protein
MEAADRPRSGTRLIAPAPLLATLIDLAAYSGCPLPQNEGEETGEIFQALTWSAARTAH